VYANPPGNSFAAQGGAGTNCNLAFGGGITPLSSRAMAATITVVNASGSGNFVVYPAGSTPGTTSALNCTAGAVLANTTVIVGQNAWTCQWTNNDPSKSLRFILRAVCCRTPGR
jgi:microcystin degradation protein MlrC